MPSNFATVDPYLKSTGAVTSSSATAGVGYATGAGGAVTQLTSKATTVIVNAMCGTITTHNASLAGAASVSFTMTNSSITAVTDVVVPSVQSGASTGKYTVAITATAVGSCQVTITNIASTAGEVVLINFAIIKAVAA